MVSIRKRRIGNEEFFYVEHTVRVNGRIEKKEKYLGKTIPENITSIFSLNCTSDAIRILSVTRRGEK